MSERGFSRFGANISWIKIYCMLDYTYKKKLLKEITNF